MKSKEKRFVLWADEIVASSSDSIDELIAIAQLYDNSYVYLFIMDTVNNEIAWDKAW